MKIKWKRILKNTYKLAIIGIGGSVITGNVILADARKTVEEETYKTSVTVRHKYFTNYGFEEVILSYQEALEGKEMTEAEYIQIINQLFETGDKQKIEEILQVALETFSDNPDIPSEPHGHPGGCPDTVPVPE